MDADDRTSVPVRTALTMEELTADEDVELWLFRMPLDFNADALTKNKFKIDEGAGTGAVLQVIDAQPARREDAEEDGLPSRETNGDSYEVLLGDASESGAYQILVQAAGDAAGVLRVAPSINRHFVVAQRPPNTPSTAAAAATESGDDDEEQPVIVLPKRPSRMVVPYTHVPQIQGLEVRFKMPGTGSAPPPPQWWKEVVKVEVEKEEEEDDDEEEEQEEKERNAKKTKEEEKKKKRRVSDGGAVKTKKGGEGGEGGREDMSSPEKKKAKKSHREKKSSKRQSV